MGFDVFTSDSKTQTNAPVTNVGASDDSHLQNIVVGKSGMSAAENAMLFEARGTGSTIASAGGQVINAAKNSTVHYTLNSTDNGAVTTAAGLLKSAIESQSNLAMQSTSGIRELGLTKLTDGANLNQKTTIVSVVTLSILAALGLIIFYFFRKA